MSDEIPKNIKPIGSGNAKPALTLENMKAGEYMVHVLYK